MRALLALALLVLTACAITVRTLEVEPVATEGEKPLVVRSPVKAHLVDGSTVVFADGLTVLDDRVVGDGVRYDLVLKEDQRVTELPLDDIAAMESFSTPVAKGTTAVASTGATAGGTVVGLGVLKAIFGSCPTTYSLEGDEPVLEAESFSYSIAPGFEARDLDRLGISGQSAGRVALEMRNEALETHYINQVGLLAVEHDPGYTVMRDGEGRALIVHGLRTPASAIDNSGRDVLAELADVDGQAWETPAARLAALGADDFRDSIVLEFPASPDAGAVAVLRLRNSLLNTVLLYDVMLKGQGFRALDWLGRDLDGLYARWQLARWYRDRMGLRISVRRDGRWREVAALDDTGPIAWQDIAVELPATDGGVLALRLDFVSDNWRIDRVALATLAGVGEFERIPLVAITDAEGAHHREAELALAQRDEDYVVTYPGQQLRLLFDTGAPPPGRERTFFLDATGYYIEWMRRDWLEARPDRAFKPGDAALLAALERWREQRDGLRERFDATRINLR